MNIVLAKMTKDVPRMPRGSVLRAFAVVALCALFASMAAASERGTLMRTAAIYVTPDATGAKLDTVRRGQEAVLLERTPGWVHVIVSYSNVLYDPDAEQSGGRTITGWIQAQGYVSESTANGDQILFGEAADSEEQASRSDGRKGAAGDARRLYFRVFELFPKSPLAGEALYRAADIQWQLDREGLRSRPLYKTLKPDERQPIDEQLMRLVHKKFPGTRWDELAAYEMLDNKLCGDWAVDSKCPEREAEIYEKYAAEHPGSPKAAEALYNAAYRWAALMSMYGGGGESKKVPEAQRRTIADAQKVIAKNASPEWNARAQRLLYMAQNNIAAYGSAAE